MISRGCNNLRLHSIVSNVDDQILTKGISKVRTSDRRTHSQIDFSIGNPVNISILGVNSRLPLIDLISQIVVVLLADSQVGSVEIADFDERKVKRMYACDTL